MPVTAKLSQAFYDRLGHEVANEMVDWFNQVDAAYRSDLRELNELNFARFDAKLEQRAAELSAKMEQRFGELSAKVDRFAAELSAKIDQVAANVDRQIAALALTVEHQQVIQMRWMVGMWLAVLIAVIGLWIRH
jgi:hypothetical protein